jgi:endonuclease/exonuclease/phosphatase family metal-dependent hydrolase
MNAVGKIVHSLILIINVSLVLMLVICGYAYMIKPVHTITSFFGYAFPLLALANLFFLVYWTFRFKIWALISLTGFFLTLGSYQAWFPVNFGTKEVVGKTFKVLTFNVMNFDFKSSKTENATDSILTYIRDLDPDIICLQEVGPEFVQKGRFSAYARKVLKPYRYQISGEDMNRYSVVFFSKHKVIKHHIIEYESLSNSSFFYDIKVGDDTLRIINNHLESNKLNPAEKDKYHDLLTYRESDNITSVAHELGSKVGNATVIRSRQADAVAKLIQETPYPLIVCGDFNDVPGSYSYRKIRRGLLDSWVEKGNGWGNTFHEKLFLFRIDYILHSPGLRCEKIHVDKVRFSDHYPMWANLQLQ